MQRSDLLKQLQTYSVNPLITQEQQILIARFQTFINTNKHCFERANKGHITSSAWIVNAQKTHALLTHHKKFNMWIQLGGHNDGEVDCKASALREAEEESGITGFTFLHDGIFDVDIHPIPGACEYHYDIRYLLQAPAESNYIVSEESHDLAWVSFEKITEYSQYSSVLRMNHKFNQYFKK